MAPKRKTPAPKNAAKRARKDTKAFEPEPVDPRVEKINKVTEAIEKYFEEPEHVKTTLLQTAGFIFENPIQDRKAKKMYYDPLFRMVGETLSNFVSQHKLKVEESEAKASNSDKIREDNIANKDGLEKALELNREKIAQHTTVVKELEMKVNQLDEDLRDRVSESKQVEAAADKMESEKGKIEVSYEAYKKVRDHRDTVSTKEAKKVAGILQKYFAKLGSYESLVASIGLILESPPVQERSSFDRMVLTEVDKVFEDNLGKLRESIAHERAQAEPQIKARELAEAACQKAKEDHEKGENVMDGLKAEAKEMTSKFKQMTKEIKNHDSNMESLRVSLETYKEELSQLEAVYEDFITLRDESDAALDEKEKQEEEERVAAQELERAIENQKAAAVAEAQKAEAQAAMIREQEKKLEEEKQAMEEKKANEEAHEKARLEKLEEEKKMNEEEMNNMMMMEQ